MKSSLFFLMITGLMVFYDAASNAQVSISTSSIDPEPSAILDVNSTSRGVLIPRMTLAQRSAISNPADGLIVYCTNCGPDESPALSVFMLGTWRNLSDCTPPNAPISAEHGPSYAKITWKWHPVTGATGYMWSTTNDINTAFDVGSDTFRIETGLTCSNNYYRHIWAYNNCGASTAREISGATLDCFDCGDDLVDDRDSKEYGTVMIGNQCWMSENLNVGTLISGTQNQADNSVIEKYCYNNLEDNCFNYGALYQWDEMMQYQTVNEAKGICIDGWHLPSDADWCTVTQYIEASVNCNAIGPSGTNVGYSMKSMTGWASGGDGSNASGFNALPAGFRVDSNGSFSAQSYNALFWTSTQNATTTALYRVLVNFNNQVYRDGPNKTQGFSVRCVMD
jgi:uncharacterized protein (TIGR02145 family)